MIVSSDEVRLALQRLLARITASRTQTAVPIDAQSLEA